MRAASCLLMLGLLGIPSVAGAQASVGPEGSVSLGLGYQFGFSDKIIETDGESFDNFKTQHHAITLAGDYATPVKGLAVEAQLAIVGAKWDSSSVMHVPTQGEWDDGDLHATPTDVQVGLRYQLLAEPLELAVSLAGSVPTHDYPVIGGTAPGRGLKGLHTGVALARTFDPWVPNLYGAASYEFSLIEKYDAIPEGDDYGQNRSEFMLQLGYFIGEQLELHASFDGSKTHGGIDFLDFGSLPASVQEHHDPLLREDAYLLGGGVGYALSEALTLGADFRLFVGGANTRNASLLSVAATYQVR